MMDLAIVHGLLPAEPKKKVSREQIERLEGEMLRMEQLPIQTNHYFAPGLYARQIVIKAGTLLTGKVHKTEHLNACTGDMTVWTEEGMRRFTGRHLVVSRPGTKRVGLAHTDTIWMCMHKTDESDLVKLEADLIEPPKQLGRESLKVA